MVVSLSKAPRVFLFLCPKLEAQFAAFSPPAAEKGNFLFYLSSYGKLKSMEPFSAKRVMK